ncbi:hypothetical protein [Streptomyces sp. NPDC101132]|uniref:hypothetical protein n=1 Tax=Streptomyces sp. NPDC101132 TaxID=3366110 RepID=UPI00381AED65
MSQNMQQDQRTRHGRTARKALAGLGAAAALIALTACTDTSADGSSGGRKKTGHSSGTNKDAGKAAKKKAGGAGKAALGGDGDFEVGSDLKPGLYRTTGNTDGMCYWERAKDSRGEADSIIANDNVTGTGYVEVKASDKIFKSTGCRDWEAVDPKAAGTPATAMKGDGGMFKVGTDIAPGTYRSTGNRDDQCYWERAKDAEHGIDSIAANDNVSGNAVVTVTAKDAYFKTTGCKDWKKS